MKISEEEKRKRLQMVVLHKATNQNMKIINYKKTNDIDVLFDDGTVSYHQDYFRFKNGLCSYSNTRAISGKELERRLTLVKTNKYGHSAKIKEWKNATNIIIQFEDKTLLKTTWQHFNEASFIHPNAKETYLINEKFGKLAVIESTKKRTKNRDIIWKCKCECGNVCEKSTHQLTGKRGAKSCGCLRKSMYKPKNPKEVAVKCLIAHYKQGAKDRNLKFELNNSDFENIIFDNCYYCNSEPQNKYIVYKYNDTYIKYNGIDRIDSSKGYTKDNIVPCCKICNIAKHNMSQNEFFLWIKQVANNLKLRETQ